ncbi:hypothetical protein CON64_22690 [Bacillus pseudomycoides]|nr:hypothetical protein CON64_22690 [Bacillus pseudomycoides]
MAKIALMGGIRTGKDTIGLLLTNHIRLAFGDEMRDSFHRDFPHIPMLPKPREEYIEYSTEKVKENKMVWVSGVEKKLHTLEAAGIKDFVITDLRQPHEYEWAKENGFIFARVLAFSEQQIERAQKEGDKTIDVNNHLDSFIHNFKHNFIIMNTGTIEDLAEEVNKLMEKIKQED